MFQHQNSVSPQMSVCVSDTPSLYFFLYLFIYMAVAGLSCSTWDLSLWHMGSLVVAQEHSSCGVWA